MPLKHSVVEIRPARFVNALDCLAEGFTVGKAQHRFLFGKRRALQDRLRVRPGKAHPDVFPGVDFVRMIGDLRVRHDQKRLARVDFVPLPAEEIISLARNNIMDDVVIAHARPPLVKRRAFLMPDVVNAQRRQHMQHGFVTLFERKLHIYFRLLFVHLLYFTTA